MSAPKTCPAKGCTTPSNGGLCSRCYASALTRALAPADGPLADAMLADGLMWGAL